MPRWHVLVNPVAGAKSTTKDTVIAAIGAAGVDAVVEVADGRDDMAERIVSHANEGVWGLAVVGGDGTVNFAVNTLMTKTGLEKPILGVLPAGTGCDLLRTFGLPQDLTEAVKHLTTEDLYEIDIASLEGYWGRRYFVNVAQTGVGAAAAETAPKLARRLGKARYPLAFATRLARFPISQVTVETERRTFEAEAIAVVMANAQFFAGGWNVAPRATLIDGVLDIQVISAAKRQAPALVPKIIRGTHLRDRSVRRFAAATFTITTAEDWPVEADGDYVGNAPVSGEVIPAALRLKI